MKLGGLSYKRGRNCNASETISWPWKQKNVAPLKQLYLQNLCNNRELKYAVKPDCSFQKRNAFRAYRFWP